MPYKNVIFNKGRYATDQNHSNGRRIIPDYGTRDVVDKSLKQLGNQTQTNSSNCIFVHNEPISTKDACSFAQNGDTNSDVKYEVYGRRYLVLLFYCLNTILNSFHNNKYTIVSNVIEKYYGVSTMQVNWTSIIFMLTFMIMVIPATLIMEKMGLRIICIASTLLTSIGAWICAGGASSLELFPLVILGQILIAIGQVFLMSSPSKVSAIWFPPKHVSTACAVGSFSNMLGVALSFLVVPLTVTYHSDVSLIGKELSLMTYGIAGANSIGFVLLLIYFPSEPPTPPSAAAAEQKATSIKDAAQSLKRICVNKDFIFLALSAGLLVGVGNVIITVINQLVEVKFDGIVENKQEFAGDLGITAIASAVLGCIVLGIIMDKTREYKKITFVILLTSLFTIIGTTLVFANQIVIGAYVVSALIGILAIGMMPVSYEFGVELTYPEPECISTGLLIAFQQCFGLVFNLIYTPIFETNGDYWANLFLCFMVLASFLVHMPTRNLLKRQKVLTETVIQSSK